MEELFTKISEEEKEKLNGLLDEEKDNIDWSFSIIRESLKRIKEDSKE